MAVRLRCARTAAARSAAAWQPRRPSRRLATYPRAAAAASSSASDGAGRPCYVTTPIYYVNDKPHIGHVYTSTIADVYCRYQRARGMDVRLQTGTDEHGLKVEQSAAKRGVDPQLLADENSAAFRGAMDKVEISYDKFVRTTSAEHKAQVQECVRRLQACDAVYLGTFEGWYDEGQEEYYTEMNAAELDYKSPISGKDMVRATEENYYFRLSAFQERIEELFRERPGFVHPSARYNEMLSRIKGGLNDVPISRTNFTWGVPMPGDGKHVIYVWIDALLNYITGLGMLEGGAAGESKYWPASVHVMAKEIVWFHSVIWPAVLMALDMPVPETVYAHAFWIRDGRKMSKSLGNFVDLPTLDTYIEAYGLDAMRYYLVRQGPQGANDANFSAGDVHTAYTAELVNTVGNCAARTAAMVTKYFGGELPGEAGAGGAPLRFEGYDWEADALSAAEGVCSAVDSLDMRGAAASAMTMVNKVDIFIQQKEPFMIAKDESRREELAAILYQAAEAIRITAVLLEPILPSKMAVLLGQFKGPEGTLMERAAWGGLQPGTKLEKLMLFPRVDEPLPEFTPPPAAEAAAPEPAADAAPLPATVDEAQALVDEQAGLVRAMKAAKAEKEEVMAAVEILKARKANLATLQEQVVA